MPSIQSNSNFVGILEYTRYVIFCCNTWKYAVFNGMCVFDIYYENGSATTLFEMEDFVERTYFQAVCDTPVANHSLCYNTENVRYLSVSVY